MKIRFAFVMLLGLAGPAMAQNLDKCRDIKDGAARLACFDAIAGAPPVSPPPPLLAATADNRARYATQIERDFLKNGGDISIMAPEKAGEMAKYDGVFKKFPRLIIFARMNKPFVYQMVAETKLLETAHALGFAGIEFMDKGPNGRWFFDLSGPGALPRCDLNRGLCY